MYFLMMRIWSRRPKRGALHPCEKALVEHYLGIGGGLAHRESR